jgi:hypothetical protein
MSLGYVYLIVEADDKGYEKYKIGVTKKNPDERVKKLRTGNSNELFVIKKYQSENYRKIEKWFHRKYVSQRTISQNEFFELTNEQVLRFIDDCKEIDQTINYLRSNNPFFK